jgi:hypothetical protein
MCAWSHVLEYGAIRIFCFKTLLRPEAISSTLVPTRVQEANQPLPPRHQRPPATVVDAQWPAAAHAARWPSPSPRSVPSRARSGRRERHSRFEACTRLFSAQCTSPNTASKPQQRAILTQRARPPEPPGRVTETLHDHWIRVSSRWHSTRPSFATTPLD